MIFVLSAQPDLRFTPDDSLDFVIRKAGHMAAFGLLALLLWWALAATTVWPRAWLLALALAVAYAVTDELHQGAVSGRHASGVDVGIDATGAAVAIAIAGLIVARRGRRPAGA